MDTFGSVPLLTLEIPSYHVNAAPSSTMTVSSPAGDLFQGVVDPQNQRRPRVRSTLLPRLAMMLRGREHDRPYTRQPSGAKRSVAKHPRCLTPALPPRNTNTPNFSTTHRVPKGDRLLKLRALLTTRKTVLSPAAARDWAVSSRTAPRA